MLPSVIGEHDAALRLGIFRSMNQLVGWNRRRFPLGHGPFANDTFCKTTGDLATLRKRHGIQCATMGTKEGTSRRDSPCQRHGTPPFVQSNCTPGKECVLELNRTRLAHIAERHRRAGWVLGVHSIAPPARRIRPFARERRIQSTWIFASLMIGPHLAISRLKNEASSLGVEPIITAPPCSSLSLTVGAARAATVSALIFPITC